MKRLLNGRLLIPALIALALMTTEARTGDVLAQDAAPAGVPLVPEPAACQAEPRTVESITAVFAGATPVAYEPAVSVEVQLGVPADAATAGAVTATLIEAVACLNGGDFARFFALLSDDAIRSAFSWLGPELADGSVPPELTTARPMPVEYRQTVLAVGTVGLLADGRATAILAINDPSSDSAGHEMLYLILTSTSSGWMIDEIHELTPNEI